MSGDAEALLGEMFRAAVAAVDPAHCVAPRLPEPPAGRTVVVGAGKAAAAMARAVEAAWPGPLSGLVITRYGHGLPCRHVEAVEAGHPVPDAAGRAAAARMLGLVHGLTPTDLVLALMSGGGSALTALPAPGLTLEDKQRITRALLNSGAPIREINCVRKHLSAFKGGRLALAAHPARVVTLAISDIPGDDASAIASGPTVADPTTRQDAAGILARRGIDTPPAVAAWLAAPESETPKPGDSRLAGCEMRVVAAAFDALAAAAEAARRAGVTPLVLGDAIEGESREVARAMAAMAMSCARHGVPARPPCVLISGGETTVTVRGPGRGGRNAEFLLALALALDGAPGIRAIACDTDGIDGSEDNCGALLRPDSLVRAAAAGVSGADSLARNDAYGFFAAIGDLVVTGPTRTNVNDFRAILVDP